MERFNELIRLLLAFGLEQTLHLTEAEIKPLFEQHFADNDFPEAGSWFWGKPVKIREPLLRLLVIPVAQKQAVLAAFVADLDLVGRFGDGRLQALNLPEANYEALTIVGEIVQNCYTDILATNGVPADKLKMDAPLDRQTVLRAYLDAQNRRRVNGRLSPLKVCPGCDGKPPSVSDGKIHEDLDHFFPKSRYPLLAVHLLNLTPFCKDCNQTYKGTKDAILDDDAQVTDVHCLHDIYHPYLRPALSDVEVRVERDAEGSPQVVLQPVHNDQQQLARLQSLLYTLNVNSRWSGDLIEERLRPKLEMFLMYGWQTEWEQDNWQVDVDKLRDGLETAVATLSRFIGREPGNVATLAYAQWLVGNEAGLRDWLAVETAVMDAPVYQRG
ncbi:MAG: hypothetical protein KDE56_00825 [Anaerolineales bacterium]|nr:hypothetical protein [Anaerolineales bacterium]